MPSQPQRRRAPARSRSFAGKPPTFQQFLLLSMLLHLLIIVLFGNPTGSGSRRSESWLGPLDVRLRQTSPEALGTRIAPGADRGRAGELRRLRDAVEPPSPTPEATTEEIAKPIPTPFTAPQKIERIAPARIERELAPAPTLTPSTVPSAPTAPLERVAPARIERELAPAPALTPSTVPSAPTAPLERVAPAQIERELAPPAALTPSTVPSAPTAPLERVAPARIGRELAPPAALTPSAVPSAPTAPLERVAPARIERELAPAPALTPSAVPSAPTAPLERVAPAQIRRELAPPSPLPSRAVPAAPTVPLERVTPPRIDRPIEPPARVPAPPAPSEIGEPRPASPAPLQPQASPVAPSPFGTPDSNEDIFKPRRDAGSAEAPRIDLEAARKKAARAIVSEEGAARGIFTIPGPAPVEKKSKAAMAMEKALKPDCRTAYAQLGLLAVPVLVASAITDDGSCRW